MIKMAAIAAAAAAEQLAARKVGNLRDDVQVVGERCSRGWQGENGDDVVLNGTAATVELSTYTSHYSSIITDAAAHHRQQVLQRLVMGIQCGVLLLLLLKVLKSTVAIAKNVRRLAASQLEAVALIRGSWRHRQLAKAVQAELLLLLLLKLMMMMNTSGV